MLKFFKSFSPLNILMLTLAGIINAIGVTLILVPVNLFDSGISGTSALLNSVTPEHLVLPLFLIVLNFPFYLLANKKLGVKFVFYSLYAISIYSLGAFVIQLLPLDFSIGSPIVGKDKLLAAVFGGLISGVGSGLTIRYGGAIDGVEVLAVLFAKKLHVTVGTFVMIYNVILYTVSAFVYTSWEVPLYSILAYAVGIKAVDFVVEGLDKGKAAFIISDKAEQIAAAIAEELKRGVTVFNGMGFYSKQEKQILYVVVNRFEIAKLQSIVMRIDEKTIISVHEASEITGLNVQF